jgi:hypothetical protein
MPSRACSRFNFSGDQQKLSVGSLSGGERGHFAPGQERWPGGNVLLLDEPSNDLDVETLRALEALLEFAAAPLRSSATTNWFLDRIATHIWPLGNQPHSGQPYSATCREVQIDKKRLGAKPSARFKSLALKLTHPHPPRRAFGASRGDACGQQRPVRGIWVNLTSCSGGF